MMPDTITDSEEILQQDDCGPGEERFGDADEVDDD